jgi:hypothetical protein
VVRAIREMKDKNTTEDDDVPGDTLKLLEEGLKLRTHLINNTYETGRWLQDFTDDTMIALKKPKATKCSNHHTINLTAQIEKIIVRILKMKD